MTVLIFCSPQDTSVESIINWLDYYECQWRRYPLCINDISLNDEPTFQLNICIDEVSAFGVNSEKDVYSIWSRGEFYAKKTKINSDSSDENITLIHNWLLDEKLAFLRSCMKILSRSAKAHIGRGLQATENKLSMLRSAKKIGLKIPRTIITNNRKSLSGFCGFEEFVITKSITEVLTLTEKKDGSFFKFMNYTSGLNINDLMHSEFPVSKFQSRIEKVFEVRSFYLDGKGYSNATFTSMSESTEIDSRIYNFEKPNKEVPFTLPESISEKCIRLGSKFGLNGFSIDMIFSTDNDYYFLELNPVGQYLGLSTRSNYNLDHLVVLSLLNGAL